VALLRFLGCTADAHEFAELVGGDDIGLRAAIAPVLGGRPGEFAAGVMPRIGAGHGALRRAGLVLGMMRGGKERVREGVRAHCELGERLRAKGKSRPVEEDYSNTAAGVEVMPWRVEPILKERGANYISAGLFKAFAIRDGRLVTGQQQYSGRKVAQLVIEMLGV
jgi:putative intracellular protease/amidase